MDHLKQIEKLEQIKIIADPRRLAILRMLMTQPATLSMIGKAFGEHPARIRHHLKQLERIGLVELVSTQTVRGFVEKYYRARSQAFMFHEIILPAGPDPDTVPVVELGSHDLALELLFERARAEAPEYQFVALPVGSLDGLIALRQGSAQLAGCHLLDPEHGDYNLSYIRRLFPERSVRLFTLAYRQQGLILPPGNPRGLHSLEDLAKDGLVLANRNPGSGTRLWTDAALQKSGIQADQIGGYTSEFNTHTEAAQAVAQGKADACIGLQAAAQQFGLGFIPLFEERYDIAVKEDLLDRRALRPLMDGLNSGEFRRRMASLSGYNPKDCGKEIRP